MSSRSAAYRRARQNHKSGAGRIAKKTFAVLGKVLISLFLICVITGSIVATALTVYVIKFIDPSSGIDLSERQSNFSTVLYAGGEDLASITDGGDADTDSLTVLQELIPTNRREFVPLDQIPEEVQYAFICTEDKRFYEHNGVDFKRTFLAFANLFLHFYSTEQGGSTITQQLIKTVTGDNDTTIDRKVQEIFRAMNLEKRYSKDDILEGYLNEVYLGNQCTGVQAAAKFYFNKDVSRLSIAEAAALAATAQTPSYCNPLDGPEENATRRNHYTIPVMQEMGVISAEEYNEAIGETLKLDINTGRTETSEKTYSYFVDQVLNEVSNDLTRKLDYTKEEAEDLLANGGLKIYTTESEGMQTALEKYYSNPRNFGSGSSDNITSCMVVMDYSGAIRGMVSEIGEKTENRVWNQATMENLNPGSSMKPIAAYAPAIEKNLITYSTVMQDKAFTKLADEDGRMRDWPKNYDGTYHGNVSMLTAITQSYNTIPVFLQNMLTTGNVITFLRDNLGLTTLVEDTSTPNTDVGNIGLAIGNLTNGIHLHELTAAYEIFGSGGVYHRPYTYYRVEDSLGNVLLENTDADNIQAISADTASVVNKMMQSVVQRGTGTAARLSNTTVAGKTGTSDADEAWTFVGCTPDLVAGTWIGSTVRDSAGKPVRLNSGRYYSAAQIWGRAMPSILEELEDPVTKDFTYSDDMVQRSYCTSSGKLATSRCGSTAVGYYRRGNVPGYCTSH